jgi:hypothetical protein
MVAMTNETNNYRLFYKFRNGKCLVIPLEKFNVNGKAIDICREDEIKLDFNPYHDKRGRFTTKSESGAFVRPKELLLWEFPKKDGETTKEWLARFEAAEHEQDAYMDSFYKESEDRIKKYIGRNTMPMNLRDELDPDMVKDLADGFDAFAKAHPEIKGAIDFIRVDELRYTTVAQFSITGDHGNGIDLNKQYFKTRKALKEIHDNDVAENFHTQGTDPKQYFQHELAHALEEKMNNDLWKKGFDKSFEPNGNGVNKLRDVNLSKELYDKVIAEVGEQGIADNVSRYATINSKEFFAECIAESVNSPNPRPMAKRIAREFVELVKAKEALLEE